MRRTAIDNSPQPNCQTPTQMPIKTGRLINNYHCKRNGLNMGEINIIYCQLDSGSEEQRQKGLHLCFPLSSSHCAPSPKIGTPPTLSSRGWTAGAAVIGPEQLLSTAPACPQFPLLWNGLSPMGCTPPGKQKCLSMGSPQAVVPSGALHLLQCWFLLLSCICGSAAFSILSPFCPTADFSGAILFWAVLSPIQLWSGSVGLSHDTKMNLLIFFKKSKFKTTFLSSNMRCIILYVSINTAKASCIKH